MSRKKYDEEPNARKKRKLEPLVNWGSGGEGLHEGRIRDWLLDTAEQGEEVNEDKPGMPLLEIAEPSRKLRQLEISFSRCLESDVLVEPQDVHGEEVEKIEVHEETLE